MCASSSDDDFRRPPDDGLRIGAKKREERKHLRIDFFPLGTLLGRFLSVEDDSIRTLYY